MIHLIKKTRISFFVLNIGLLALILSFGILSCDDDNTTGDDGDIIIENVQPLSGPYGTTVTISGSGFNPDTALNQITFAGTPAPVTGAGETQLSTTVPEGAESGQIEVMVDGNSAVGPDFSITSDTTGNENTNAVTNRIEDDDELSTLASQLNGTDLQTTLQGDGPYTVLAPTNTAFDNLPSDFLDNVDQNQLNEILSYHAISDDLTTSDLSNTPQMIESLQGESLYLAGDIDINNKASVTGSDTEATNGNIHKIDEVVLPDEFLNVFEITYKRYNTNKFACACVSGRTGLEEILRDEDSEFTIFAPSDAAFNSRDVSVDELSDDVLEDLLNNHIIEEQVLSDELNDGDTFTTRNDYEITVSVDDDNITLNGGVTVEETDLEGTNGVVYIIDSTLE